MFIKETKGTETTRILRMRKGEKEYGITGTNAGNCQGQKEQLVQGKRTVQRKGRASRWDFQKQKSAEQESEASIQSAPAKCGL